MTKKITWKRYDPSLTEKEVLETISELNRLKAENQLSAGHVEGKDRASHMAIMAACQLVDTLAGWAFNHQIGVVINETLDFPNPSGEIVKVKNRSEHEERQRLLDEHRHETTASACLFNDPIQNRRILARLFRLNMPGLPLALSIKIATALEAIDFGETMPLLARDGIGRQKIYRKEILRFWAALHVEYLRGLGRPRQDALALVGDAYDREPETIEGWISDLPSKVGHVMNIAVHKHRARAAGEMIRDMDSPSFAADLARMFDPMYGPLALKENGDEYQRIAGHSEKEAVIIDFSTT